MFSEIKWEKKGEKKQKKTWVTDPVNVVYENKPRFKVITFNPQRSYFYFRGEMNLLQLSTTICSGELDELTAQLCGNAPIMSESL